MIKKITYYSIIFVSTLIISGCGGKSSDLIVNTASESGLSESRNIEGQEANATEQSDNIGSSSKEKSEGNVESEADNRPSKEDSYPVSPIEPLNMEEDDFSLIELIQQIGTPIAETRNALGMENDINEKDGTLFGETVKVSLKDNDELCNSIQVSFLGTPMDSLEIAISEQLGDDGKEVEDGVLWVTEDAFILLYESAEGCYLDLGSE